MLEAARLAAARREACLREGRSVAFETVFSGPDKVDFVERGLRGGFFVRLFFVGTDTPTINAARVAERVLRGGHDVPIRKIVDRWSRSILNCARVARLVDRLYVYDNSKHGDTAKILLRAAKGTLTRAYGPPRPWMAPLLSELAAPGSPS